MSSEGMNFDDISLAEVQVNIGSKPYVLREAMEETACRYRNAILEGTEYGTDGKLSKARKLADVEPMLVALCLFTKDDNGVLHSVPEKTIRGWPSKVVKRLFQKIKEISELDEQETVAALEKRLEEMKAKEESSKND